MHGPPQHWHSVCATWRMGMGSMLSHGNSYAHLYRARGAENVSHAMMCITMDIVCSVL